MSLEEEIKNSWKELEARHQEGVFNAFRVTLEEQALCGAPEQVDEDCQDIEEISREISKYFRIGEPSSGYEESFDDVNDLKYLVKDRIGVKKKCIDKHLLEIESEYKLNLLETSSAVHKRSQDLKHLSNASHSLEYEEGFYKAQELLEEILEVPFEEEDDRFHTEEVQARYDKEYHEIKKKFDSMNPSNKKDLFHLKELAESSQNLTEKYKSINDEDGINHSARLHEDIEEAAERLAPIYEGWKFRKVTIGMILLGMGLGFWKGDYIKNQIIGLLSQKEEVQATSSLTYIPEAVVEAVAGYPGATHAVYFNIGELSADLYDVIDRERELEFPFTSSLLNTPKGAFKVETYGQGLNTPANMGTAFIQLEGIDSVFISGTYDSNILRGIDEDRYMTQKNIILKDEDMIELYSKLTGSLEETIVVIEK